MKILKTMIIFLSLSIFANEQIYLDMLSTSHRDLQNKNLELKLGELTGAGKTIPLNKLEVLFTPDSYILKKEIKNIVYKEKALPVAADILEIHLVDEVVTSELISAFIIRH